MYHAVYIVHCVENRYKPFHSTEIVAIGRLGTSVKKRVILASLNDGIVNYITLNWIDT